MSGNAIFNAAICAIGIAIILIHSVNLLLKKGRRKDENRLLVFLLFTIIHFATYLTFTLVKTNYTSDAYVITFYTIFYIFNNVEMLLLFLYMLSYVKLSEKVEKTLSFFNYFVFSIFIILDIVNIFTHMFFTSIDGEYTRANLMILSQGYQFIMFVVVFLVTIINKELVVRQKIAFAFYCLLPLIAIILQNFFKGYAIAYLALLIAVEILFLFLNVEKNIMIEEDEKKLKDANVKIMMSQIQPHFIYNTLSSISTLTTIDPGKAQKALDDFSDYLRMNFSSLTDTRLVPFADELQHIKTYVGLEKLRFNDRLKIVYDIQTMDFYVPPLSIQPIVENAIKHGIIKKVEGGTVTLRIYENDTSHVVEIIDDGVGFDVNKIDFKNNKHIGLNNVRQRITSMCKGDIHFESENNNGTKAIISFYKE